MSEKERGDTHQEDMKDDKGMAGSAQNGAHDGSPPAELFNDSTTLLHASSGSEESEEAGEENVQAEEDKPVEREDGAEAKAAETETEEAACLPENGTSPSRSSSSPVYADEPLPSAKLKVTTFFMQAYKIMRGPRDVEPSPLFGCLRKKTGSEGGIDGDSYRLASLEETKLLREIDDEIICDSDEGWGHTTNSHTSASRQSIFYLEPPEVTAPPYDSDDSDLEDGDYCFDDDRLDEGWTRANFVFNSSNGSVYNNDGGDDGGGGDDDSS